MVDWFRSWHGAPTDPKWLGIAKRAKVAAGIAVAVAWALMDRASQASERGVVAGYDAEGLAAFFGCEAEQVDAIVKAMTDKGMIDGDGKLANWERRQPKREDDSSGRVKAFRERAATQEAPTETQAKRDVTRRNAPEESREEQKIKPLAQQPTARAEMRCDDLVARLLKAAGVQGNGPTGLAFPGEIMGLIEAGFDLEADILAVIRSKPNPNVRSWGYYVPIIREAADKRRSAASVRKVEPAAIDWAGRMRVWRDGGTWTQAWGPRPGDKHCLVPTELLQERAA